MSQELELLAGVESENRWFQSHYGQIQEEHPNQFVAIADQKVIAAGKKAEAVVEQVKKIGKDPAVTLIEFVPKKGLIVIL